jgi:hypothetical protein
MPYHSEDIQHRLTAVLRYISTKAHHALDTAIPYLPDRTKANLVRLLLSMGVVTIASAAWFYHRQLEQQRLEEARRLRENRLEQRLAQQHLQQRAFEKKKQGKDLPVPLTIVPSTSTATLDLPKITPPHQIAVFDTAPLGLYTPRNAPLTSPMLERTYNSVVRGHLGIEPDDFEPQEDDEHYDVLRHLTPVQRALLRTLNDEHQRRILWGLHDDWHGSIWAKESEGVGEEMSDAEFKQVILRRAV